MTESAMHAIRAANHERQWGARPARQYARKRGAFRLFLLARVLREETGIKPTLPKEKA